MVSRKRWESIQAANKQIREDRERERSTIVGCVVFSILLVVAFLAL